MAISATALTAAIDGTDTDVYTTASITPSPNKLVLLWVMNGSISAPATTQPVVDGNSGTWTSVATAISPSGGRRLTLYKFVDDAPTSGVVTIDFETVTQLVCGWHIAEYTNANIHNPIVQSASNNGTGITSLTVTLDTFGSPANATAGTLHTNVPDERVTPGTGFTEISDVGTTTGVNHSSQSQYRADNDTSVDWSWTTSGTQCVGLAVEIAHMPQLFNLTGAGV